MDIIKEAKIYLERNKSKKNDLHNLPLDLISRLVDRLEKLEEDRNLEAEVFLNGGMTQWVLEKGQLVKKYITKEQIYLPPVGDK